MRTASIFIYIITTLNLLPTCQAVKKQVSLGVKKNFTLKRNQQLNVKRQEAKISHEHKLLKQQMEEFIALSSNTISEVGGSEDSDSEVSDLEVGNSEVSSYEAEISDIPSCNLGTETLSSSYENSLETCRYESHALIVVTTAAFSLTPKYDLKKMLVTLSKLSRNVARSGHLLQVIPNTLNYYAELFAYLELCKDNNAFRSLLYPMTNPNTVNVFLKNCVEYSNQLKYLLLLMHEVDRNTIDALCQKYNECSNYLRELESLL